jgi:hypothetical protein
MDVLAGYTGGKIWEGESLAQAMAWPASLPLADPAGKGCGPSRSGRPGKKTKPGAAPPERALPELPSADRGTCILALPRTSGGTDALDRFLNRRASPPPPCEIVFLYTENGPAPVREAAETCARLYGARNAVRAQAIAVPEAPGAGIETRGVRTKVPGAGAPP